MGEDLYNGDLRPAQAGGTRFQMAQYWTGKRDGEADLYVYDDTAHCYILVDKDAVCAENRILIAFWFKAGGLKEKGEEEGPQRATLGYREKVPDDTPFPSPPGDWDGQDVLQIEDEHWDETGLQRPVLPMDWAYEPYQFWVPGVHGEDSDLLVWDKAHKCFVLVLDNGEGEVCWHFTPGSINGLPSTPPREALDDPIDISNVYPPPPDDFDGHSMHIEWGARKTRPKLPDWAKGSQDPFEPDMSKSHPEAPTSSSSWPSIAAGAVSTSPDPNATVIIAAVTPDDHEKEPDPNATMMVAPVPFQSAAPEPAAAKKAGRFKEGLKAIFLSWPAAVAGLLLIMVGLVFYAWGTAERNPQHKRQVPPPAKAINVMAPPKQPPGMPTTGMASQPQKTAKKPDAGVQVDKQALKRKAERLRKEKAAREAKLKREEKEWTALKRRVELRKARKLRLRAARLRRQRLARQKPRRRPKLGCQKRVGRHCVDGLTASEIQQLRNRSK